MLLFSSIKEAIIFFHNVKAKRMRIKRVRRECSALFISFFIRKYADDMPIQMFFSQKRSFSSEALFPCENVVLEKTKRIFICRMNEEIIFCDKRMATGPSSWVKYEGKESIPRRCPSI